MNTLATWLTVIAGFLAVLGVLGRVLVLVTRHIDGQRNLQIQLAELAAATAKQRRRDKRRFRRIERQVFRRPIRGPQPALEYKQ